jgi:hypothetical protein
MKKNSNTLIKIWKNKSYKIWPPMDTPVNTINKPESSKEIEKDSIKEDNPSQPSKKMTTFYFHFPNSKIKIKPHLIIQKIRINSN